MINWWKTELNDLECKAAFNAIKNKHLSAGPIVKEFEDEFAKLVNVKYAVACPSGSMALVMALLSQGIKPNDEVIVPASTWISTAHAPMLIGAKTVLVDVLKDRPIIDCNEIEKKINSKTKAIIPVHLNGRSAGIKQIKEIAEKYNLKIIEDACQAMFSKNGKLYLGTESEVGCFSFGVTKLITTGQGGMVVSNNGEIYEKLLLIRNNGMQNILTPEYKMFGANFKFSDVLAAIGIVQLNKAKKHAKSVKKLYIKYEKALENLETIKLIKVNYKEGELPLYVEIVTDRRTELMEHLKKDKINTRVLPPALVEAPQLRQDGDYQNAIFFGNNGMYLPSGPDQKNSDIEKVILSLNEFEKLY